MTSEVKSRLSIGYATTAIAWLALGAALASSLLRAGAKRRRRAAREALERERRHVAGEIHDLIMQDLSLALANARTLAARRAAATQANTADTAVAAASDTKADWADTEQMQLVVSAGERALAGARKVLSGL